MRMRRSSSGTPTPARAAVTRLITIAAAMTPPSGQSPNHSAATTPTTIAQARPLSRPTITSLLSRAPTLPMPTWPRAMPRTISVSVWVPATPPMLATIGISTASATRRSMVPSKRPMTHEARKAVSRLMPSHSARRRAARATGLNMSSSSSRPAALSAWCAAWSRMMSTTSSMVMRPSRMLLWSTTGADTQSWSENWLATSCAGVSTWMAGCSSSKSSLIGVLASWVSSEATDTRPRYWWRRLTTNRWSVCSGISPRRRR